MKFTDSPDEVLYDHATHGLYMEWCKKKEANFLWISNIGENTTIRLEILAGFGDCLQKLEDKNPILAFSQGFANDAKWREVKILLQEIFGRASGSAEYVPSHIYTFTRINEKFHLRIFKVNQWPNPENQAMKLEEMGPSFVFCPTSYDENPFVNADMLCMDDRTVKLKLKSKAVTRDRSYSSAIRHYFDQPGNRRVFLPPPRDTIQWEGFNNTPEEFFQRYYAFKRTEVPGTGSPPPPFDTYIPSVPLMEIVHLCPPFKLFGRSLVLRCEEAFNQNLCYAKIKIKNLFFRRKELKILGVQLVEFSFAKAIENLRQVGIIIQRLLNKLGLLEDDFPDDLKDVLQLLSTDPFGNLDLIKNHICWMEGLDRILMTDDILDEFLNHMTATEELEVGRSLPRFSRLTRRINRNWLLTEMSINGYPRNDSEKQSVIGSLKHKVNGNEALANRLFCIRQFFKTPRNAFHHLVQTAQLFNMTLTREEVEFIIYSLFADVYMRSQVGITQEFSKRTWLSPLDIERSSYERFGRYFRGHESIIINERDKK